MLAFAVCVYVLENVLTVLVIFFKGARISRDVKSWPVR